MIADSLVSLAVAVFVWRIRKDELKLVSSLGIGEGQHSL
jgi:hypothetical protein